ncbi:MAG TPA: DUF1800 domain-containing protein [Acidobacteriaceae bacterium]|jgi:uncharacterized protein (DUF1800 family)|nr:DUF1800 domain-containing protein [Acidobacteriaceae bacterium]
MPFSLRQSCFSIAFLCALLPSAVSYGFATPPVSRTAAGRDQIAGNARILHVLNRLTFGVQPQDFAAVKAMGVEAWINQQLYPGKIDDAAVQEMLKKYPATQMKVKDLLRQLPPPPVIRAVANGRISIPDNHNPVVRAIYLTQLASYQQFKEARKAKLQAQNNVSQNAPATAPAGEAPPPASGMNPLAQQNGQRVNAADPGIAEKEQQILADLQATGIVNLPPQQRMAKILAMQPLERISFYGDLTREEKAALTDGVTPQQAQTIYGMMAPARTVAAELMQAKMLRALYSRRQLLEVMTDFWMNHFNVDIHKNAFEPYYLIGYERDVIRPHALGKFEDLLVATAQSPAMLDYLDNATSVGPHSFAASRAAMRGGKNADRGINENYGRELMELQTLGVNGGYTQRDVIEVAKVFTGWTIDHPLQGGGFIFDPRRHEPGTKYVLGHTIHQHGEGEGLEVLHILATSPATAQHISNELAMRFVSDHPPQSLVDRMARTFLATQGDIRQVLRTMFFSPEFWAAGAGNAKFKTPLEFVASATRASGADVNRPGVLVAAIGRLGMPLYGCQPPTGYSMNQDAWISSGALVERMNFAVAFSHNRLPGIVNHWDAQLGPNAASMQPSQKITAFDQIFFHGHLSLRTQQAVLADVQNAPAQSQGRQFVLRGVASQNYVAPIAVDESEQQPFQQQPFFDRQAALAAGLLIGSPDFQYR